MKVISLAFFCLFIFIAATANTYYSQGSLSPNLTSSWNTIRGGGGSMPSDFLGAGDIFIVQNGHTMTTTATWTLGSSTSKLQIETGGVLSGAHSIQLPNATFIFQIDDGGKYIHNNTNSVSTAAGASIWSATESFAANSDVEIQQWVNNTTAFVSGITWGNLIINLNIDLGTTWNWNLPNGSTLTILGNLDVRSTYITSACEIQLTPSGNHFINVNGNFFLSGTTTRVSMKKSITVVPSLSGYTTMQVNGDISLTGNAWLHTGDQTSTVPVKGLYDLRFKGNFSAVAGTTVTAAGLTSYLVANGVTQTFNCIPTISCSFRVAPGSTLSLIAPFSSSSSSVVNIAGTLNQNFQAMTVIATFEIAGGIFNSNGPLTIGYSCTPCTGDGTYNGTNNTWCTLTGVRGAVNFINNNAITLKNDVFSSYLAAGSLFSINSPGDVYFVNSTAMDLGSAQISGYITRSGSIFSLDENSYIAGGTQSIYQGWDGTLRLGSTNGITAFPDATGNVRTQTRSYDHSGVNSFEYFGTNPQVTGNGLPTAIDGTLKINNTAGISSLGVTLSQNTTVDGILDLTRGKLRTLATSLMSISATGNITNYGDSSFIGGPLKETGHDSFLYPIGINSASAPTGTIYAPLSMVYLSGTVTSSDSYTAEYLRDNPHSSVDPDVGDTIDHISYVEYWKHERNDEGSNTPLKKIVLRVNYESICYNLDSLMVARFDTLQSKWLSEGNSLVNSTGTSGLLVSGYLHSEYIPRISGAFTLSTNLPFPDNPLPINMVTFNATKRSDTRSSIEWELAAYCSPSAKFEIQRAGKDKEFITIGTVSGNAASRFYDFSDNDLKTGINFYRLKMIDEHGKTSYSRVVAIMNGVDGVLLTSLIPTVVNDKATLTVTSSGQRKLDIMIVDMQGRVVIKQNYMITAGNTGIEIAVGRLAAGVYQLTGITEMGKTNLIRFIKQ